MIVLRFTLPRLCLASSVVCFQMALLPYAFGQAATSALDGPAFAAPSEIISAAAKVTPEKYANVTILYEEEKDVLDAEGRVTSDHRLIYRIETQAGVEAWSESAVAWEAFYQKEPTIRARVIRPGGSVAELDAKTITDVPARNEGDGTYSDERIHKAPLPGLSVGAIVESETIRIDKEPFFNGGGVYRFFPQREVPVMRTRFIVEAPAALPLQYRVGLLPGIAVKDESAAGTRRLVFDQGYLAAEINSDIHLATRVPRFPTVEVSTGKSWESVAEAYRLLAEPQIQLEQAKEFVHGANPAGHAPADAEGRVAFIQALVSRLHKEVRYTGIEFGQAKLQPQTPTEVLKRHYGDCKDKASLLVSMLRASGVPADLALLNAGPGRDVTPDLPGMNQFDHAIVYVPPTSAGGHGLWIDATAEFTRVGDLPYGDQGRLALVIEPGTKELTLTPEAHPEDSVLVETREFTLADYGPAKAIESSHSTGHIDSIYRSEYGDTTGKEVRSALESYVRNAYAAKALGKVESGDAKDFTKPFALRLEIDQTKRGNTGVSDAYVALFPTGAFGRLPRWFFMDPDQGSQTLTAEEKADREKAQEQRAAEYEVEPSISERRYRIIPPAGFLLRALPTDKTTQMGPATFTQTYSSDFSGVITAAFRFNTGKAHYTTEEALELRKAVLAANKEDAVSLLFDQTGAKQFAAGKVREALSIDRGLIDAHPNDPLPHIRMAYALLAAGVGEAARAEAMKATVLAPKSALAFSTLGWMLQFNAIGVRLAKGSDLNDALAAYRTSKSLDPEDLQTRINLAFLSEYDATAARYTSVEGLKAAIQEYRDLGKQDKATGEQYEDNLLFDLLYSHQYKELVSEVETLPGTDIRNSLGISATVAAEGVDAGLKRANRLSADSAQRSRALGVAGAQLIALRMYPEAAAILSASIEGQENAAAVSREIEIFRTLQPFTPRAFAEDTPTAVVQGMMADAVLNKLSKDEIAKIMSRNAYASQAEWEANVEKTEESTAAFQALMRNSGLTRANLADITLGTTKISAKGDDATGYRVTMQTIGAPAQQFFVMKEEGCYKIVASQGDLSEVGNFALYSLHHGNEGAARNVLDWKRDLIHKGGGDDPLNGPLLARVWTSGESNGADAIELASASLIAHHANVAALLPAIAARRDHWTQGTQAQGKPDLTDLNLVLATGYVSIGDEPRAKVAAEALLKDWPDSVTAMRLAGAAYALDHDWAAWNSLLDAQLAKHPNDRELLWERARAAQAQGEFAGAGKFLHTVLDGGQATSSDYNFYSWNTLFEKSADADAIQTAQQANALSNNRSFADLHTLACVYAAQGKTTEAKQVLLQAMDAAGLGQPNSEVWFGFGALYEQYGVADAAVEAFRKVKKPEGTISPTDTYVLAQAHLKELKAAQ
jgi:tetratricopeptide (TPR) repeat protein